jgi:hypothetical protein
VKRKLTLIEQTRSVFIEFADCQRPTGQPLKVTIDGQEYDAEDVIRCPGLALQLNRKIESLLKSSLLT